MPYTTANLGFTPAGQIYNQLTPALLSWICFCLLIILESPSAEQDTCQCHSVGTAALASLLVLVAVGNARGMPSGNK